MDVVVIMYILTTLLPIHALLYLARMREREKIRTMIRNFWIHRGRL